MASSSSNTGDIIQRLNLVHAPHPTAQPSESAQDLLSAPSYGDLAQLDLWTNVAFAPDEPFVPTDLNSDDGSDKDGKESASALVKRKRDILAKKAHFNTAAAAATAEHQTVGAGPSSAVGVHQATALFPPATAPVVPYDLPGLLAIAGNQFSPDTMNLNQILYGNPFQTAFAFPGSFPQFMPATAPAPAPQQHQASHPAPTSGSTAPPPAKKAKRKSSTTTPAPVRPTPAPVAEPQSPADDSGAEDDGRPLTSAEDKRRRNTQASARFRLKKKERELAMESKCKELESKVGELERECEALRRENGWLKGLVVGVTGGTGMPMSLPTGPGLPTLSSTTTTSSGKRKRDSTSSESSSSS